MTADWVMLEAVDQAYRPMPAGAPSHTVLLTNLANFVQPIIRSDLGDSITVRPDPRPCGNPLPAIRVEGRTDEILHLQAEASGRIPVRPMGITTIVAGAPGVRRFQAVQTGLAALQIQLEMLPDADETQVWDAMSSRLHDHLDAQGVHGIHLEKAAELPHQHPISGAFRYVWAEQCV